MKRLGRYYINCMNFYEFSYEKEKGNLDLIAEWFEQRTSVTDAELLTVKEILKTRIRKFNK